MASAGAFASVAGSDMTPSTPARAVSPTCRPSLSVKDGDAGSPPGDRDAGAAAAGDRTSFSHSARPWLTIAAGIVGAISSSK